MVRSTVVGGMATNDLEMIEKKQEKSPKTNGCDVLAVAYLGLT